MEEIRNKVAESGILTIDLLEYKPQSMDVIDIKDQLWEGLVLKEKDFRNWLKEYNWLNHSNNAVCIYCSADAIVPDWAYMLVVARLTDVTNRISCNPPEIAMVDLWKQNLSGLDEQDMIGKRIVVKGCGDETVPYQIYAEFTRLFGTNVRSVMYGEPCSTVPILKNPK